MLIDSDVLIWMTRGQANAVRRLEAIHPWHISAVTYIEIAQGCRNKDELALVKNGLEMRATKILPIDAAISAQAMSLIDQYSLSHGLKLADALIAATALQHRLTLLTANAKHFGAVATLMIEVFSA